jgi:hypothetical protein
MYPDMLGWVCGKNHIFIAMFSLSCVSKPSYMMIVELQIVQRWYSICLYMPSSQCTLKKDISNRHIGHPHLNAQM